MTPPAPIASLAPDARQRLRALNNAHARETSYLEPADWDHLCGAAFWAYAIPDLGFVIALDQTAHYDSPNYLWFRDRYPRFVYVDRIVVSPDARGTGTGKALYTGLFEAARAAGHDRVACEVNQNPPNPGSDAFHAALGFRMLARRALSAEKEVAYLVRDLGAS